MTMSRKFYRDLAESLKIDVANAVRSRGEAYIEATVIRETIAPALKRDNSAFRYDYFFTACGLDVHGQWIAASE